MLQGSLNVILNIFFLFSMYNVGFQYKAAGQQIQKKIFFPFMLYKNVYLSDKNILAD